MFFLQTLKPAIDTGLAIFLQADLGLGQKFSVMNAALRRRVGADDFAAFAIDGDLRF
jgi:hypothetical protein